MQKRNQMLQQRLMVLGIEIKRTRKMTLSVAQENISSKEGERGSFKARKNIKTGDFPH